MIDASQDGEMLDVIDELPSEAVAFMVDRSESVQTRGHGVMGSHTCLTDFFHQVLLDIVGIQNH